MKIVYIIGGIIIVLGVATVIAVSMLPDTGTNQSLNTNTDSQTNQAANTATESGNVNGTAEEKFVPTTVLLKLCAERQGGLVWSCSTEGNQYYATTGGPMTVDQPMNIYDSDGTFLVSCGGYQVFTTEEARQANAATCANYNINDCRDVTNQCPTP